VYREQFIIEKPKNNSNIFKYYVGKPKLLNSRLECSFFCPICDHLHKENLIIVGCLDKRVVKCHSNKRVTISGFLFWKKLCPVAGFHTHYICESCNHHTIEHNEKANSLNFTEIQLKK
jgi:hypothetical protein